MIQRHRRQNVGNVSDERIDGVLLALRLAGTQSTGWIDGDLPQQQPNKWNQQQKIRLLFISIYLGRFDGRFLIHLSGAPLTLVGAMEIHRDARFVSSIEPLNFRIFHDVQKIATFVRSILHPKEINAHRQKEGMQSQGEKKKQKKKRDHHDRLVKSMIQVPTECIRREWRADGAWTKPEDCACTAWVCSTAAGWGSQWRASRKPTGSISLL